MRIVPRSIVDILPWRGHLSATFAFSHFEELKFRFPDSMSEYDIMHARKLSHQADICNSDGMKSVRTWICRCSHRPSLHFLSDDFADSAVNDLLQLVKESTPDLVTLQLIEVSLKRSERNVFISRQPA